SGTAHAATSVSFVQNGSPVAGPRLAGPLPPATSAPARGTIATLAADKAIILNGQSIVFTGTLTLGKFGVPLTNHAVRLEESAGGEWKTVANALASADGSVSFTVKPSTSTKYRLAYAGTRTLRATISAEQAVTVKQPPPPPRPVVRRPS